MRTIIVKENDGNQRVDKFLSKTLITLPKNLMYKYIRNKKIKVNGKRCTNNLMLQEGDVLTCYIAEEFFDLEKDTTFFKAPSTLDIVYEDENILIMNKPIGLLAHSDNKEDTDTLVNRMKHYLYKNKAYDFNHEQSFSPALCHRLDRNTQGLVIGAKNADSLRLLNQMIKERKIHKYYLAIIEGEMQPKAGMLVHYHKKEQQVVYIEDYEIEGYKKIETSYKTLDSSKRYSLLDIELLSGKSHQIRAQFAHMHHPLLGDSKYGAKKHSFSYQALCAYRISFKDIEETTLSYLNTKSFELKHPTLKTYYLSLE